MPKQPTNSNEKLFDLLEQIHEGTLPESGRVELNELLRQNPELIDDFIEYREQVASLRIIHLGTDRPDASPLFPVSSKNTSDCIVSDHDSNSTGFVSSLISFAAPILALSLIISLVSYTFLNLNRHDNRSPSIATHDTLPPVVADLVATDQCTWKSLDTAKTPQPGEPLSQGTILELTSGLAQIHYRSGVTLLLQGPGRLELAEPNAVNLHGGVVISRVSPNAIGFTVNTPGSKIIDHGTEFAVGVDEKNTTDVSVLEGKVELISANNHPNTDAHMLTAGQALRIDAEGGIELFRTIDPRRLAKNITESNEVKLHNASVSIYRLHSANELKPTGTLIQAINVGGSESIQVGKFCFEADDDSVLDSSMKLDAGWGNRPWLGNLPEDRALCQVLHSIRHNIATKRWHKDIPNRKRPVSAVIPVMPGRYRVRLLVSENFHAQRFTDRSINLNIEGVPCLRDLRMLASQGIAGHPVPPNQALLIDVEIDVTDNELQISLFSDDVPDNIDPNVILNGLIVERL